jgi:tetratricopeptide (TPR) repeat protein
MAERDTDVTDAPAHTAMDQFTAHLDRGWDLIHRGDLRGAQLSAEKSLELDPQAPEAHNLLGYVKASLGQADEALELYKQALALDDSFVEAMLNAAEVLIHPLHDFDGAISMIEEALDFAENPDETADALLLKYDVSVHQGDKEAARRVASSFPEGPFESARLDFLVGRALFECGEHAKAQRLLLHAIELEPTYGDAHYTLGLVHEALGDSKAMVQAFLRARDADLALPRVVWAPNRAAFEELVRAAIARLPAPLRSAIEHSELYIAELPGAEVVVDGVDPRASVLFDTSDRTAVPAVTAVTNVTPAAHDGTRVARMFFYQRNTERSVEDPSGLSEELYMVLEEELCATFPELAPNAEVRDGHDGHDGHDGNDDRTGEH